MRIKCIPRSSCSTLRWESLSIFRCGLSVFLLKSHGIFIASSIRYYVHVELPGRSSPARIREIKFLWNVIRLHDFIGWAAGDIELHEYLKIRPREGANFPQIIILLAPIKRSFKRAARRVVSQLFSLLLNTPLLFIILTSPLKNFSH